GPPLSSSRCPYTTLFRSGNSMNCHPKSTLAKPFPTGRSIPRTSRHPYPSQNLRRAEASSAAEFLHRYTSVIHVNTAANAWAYQRSEEHTSELQSREKLVC